jgi:outer membrane protein TolC
MIKAIKSRIPISLLAIILAGCASAPPKPELTLTPPITWQTPHATQQGVELSQWWLAFESPELNGLVEKAIAHNRDLKQADANLKAARALLAQAKTTSQPVGSLDASVQRLRQAGGSQPPGAVGPDPFGDQSVADIGLNFGWELGLSRRLEGLRSQAFAGERAMVWRRHQVEASITAQTVSAWLSWRAAQVEAVLISKKLASLEAVEQAHLKARQVGGASGDALELARAQRNALRGELPAIDATARQAARRLAVLTGDLPQDAMHGAVTDGAGESWKSPNALPDLDPVASLRMRPDVGVAEEEVMGAVAHTQISRADLYPRISLVGALGLTNDPSGLSRDNSLRFSAGPQLTWGLFNLDRTRAQINEADAKAEAAYHG